MTGDVPLIGSLVTAPGLSRVGVITGISLTRHYTDVLVTWTGFYAHNTPALVRAAYSLPYFTRHFTVLVH